MPKRDILQEIIDRKARTSERFYPVAVPLPFYRLVSALHDDIPDELLVYMSIGIVACIQGFFRSTIATLIDADPDRLVCLAKSLTLKDIKLSLDLLRGLAGRKFTTGELVAHLAPLNQREHIEDVMTGILNESFTEKLKTVRSRWLTEVNGKTPTPILSAPAAVFADLDKLFRLRHIAAHEFPAPDPYLSGDLPGLLLSAELFLQASAEIVADTLHPGAPLTQADMNALAARDAAKALEDLATIIKELRGTLDPDRARFLDEAQSAWRRFADLQADFEASQCKGGTMEPLMRSATIARLAAEQKNHLSVTGSDSDA
jgi:uncharacterized protein YecT (DUF1311 family)